MAHAFLNKGLTVKVFDPRANWDEADLTGIEIYRDPYLLSKESEFILLLTEWPEFKELDFQKLGALMKEKRLFDPNLFLKDQYSTLHNIGYKLFTVNQLIMSQK
jgi:UDPglucose 6-dehydrogenase